MQKIFDRKIHELIEKEVKKQINTVNLIASENYVSKEILNVMSSVFTNKYAEGYPGKRYYGGCKYVDRMEQIAIERACKLFKAEYANVQPHAGSQANMACYFSVLEIGDKILSMDLSAGGHLTHGATPNFSGKLYQTVSYTVDKETEMLDYEAIRKLAHREKPKMIVCGASSYSRIIDFAKFSKIAKEINAFLLTDIAHISGLIVGGLHPSPAAYAEFISGTTHKTLRGPRGGFLLCKKEFGERVDKAVFPGMQGGPLMHVVAAKAVCFKAASTNKFKTYQKQIVKNSKRLAGALIDRKYKIVSGGTDNHLMVVDLRNKGISGIEAQNCLEAIGIIANKNKIPFDSLPPAETSGIRFGTPAITSRGMKEKEIEKIAEWIDTALIHRKNQKILKDIEKSVRRFVNDFPIYPEN